MKQFTSLMSLSCILTVCIIILISPAAQAQQKAVALNYSNLYPANHRISVLSDEWCKEIEKRTNGGVKITMFHGGTLTPATQVYDGVVKGLSDIGMSVFSYHRGRFPLTEFGDLPLGIKSCVTGTRLFNEYYKKFKPKELEDTKVMYLFACSPAIVATVKKPVTKMEDLKGLKLRVTPLATPIAKALGAVPVAMPMGESYDALSKNVVDGGLIAYEPMEGWKLGEVINYMTESWSVGFMSAFYVVMNKDKWESISSEHQKIIEEINAEWSDKIGKAWDEMDASGKAFLIKQGGKIYTLSKVEGERWKKAVQPVLNDYIKMTKDKGLPGDEVIKFAKDYIKKNEK